MKRSALKIIMAAVLACSLFALCGCEESEPYTPTKKAQTVEDTSLVEAGTLTVGVNASGAPFAFESRTGNLAGLDPDYAAALADAMGLNVKVVDISTDGVAALKDGKCDVVMALDAADKFSCWTSEIYVDSASAIFAKQKVTKMPAKKSKGGKKIVAAGSSMSAWCVLEQFGAKQLKSMELVDAFDAVADKKYTYCAADAVIGSYISNISDYNFHIVALLEQPTGYVMGVAKKNTDLQGALADALASVNGGGMGGVIQGRWLGTGYDIKSVPTTPKAKKAKPVQTEKSSGKVSTSLGGVGANAVTF